MAKNIHTATLPDGRIAKRTSESRVYTHCVAVRDSYTHALAQARKLSDVDRKNFQYSVDIAEGRANPFYKPTEEQLAQRRAEERQMVLTHGNAQAYQQAMADKRVAQVEADKAAGRFDRWGVLGWCGRYDLAQKLLGGEGSKPYHAEAQILTVHLEAR